MKKSELLKQGNYLTVIKPLAHFLGLEQTIILMELVGMEEYKEQKHQIYKELMESQNKKINQDKVCFYEKDNAFECSATELELSTTIKRTKQFRILNEMMDKNLLQTVQRGIPAKRFIILNHEIIETIFDEAIGNYQKFKDSFFAEKKEQLQKQMAKRKASKKDDSLLFQNETTDNSKALDGKKVENSHSNQLFQNETTRSFESEQLVVSNENSLNNIDSIIISSSNNIKNLKPNLQSEKVDLYEILWELKIPQSLKNRIKVMMADKEIELNADQILAIEDAYSFQIQKDYIIPDCDHNDVAALNDFEFTQTVCKMLKTVKEIHNIRGLIKEWVQIAFTFKQEQNRIMDISQESVHFDDWFNESASE